MNCAYWLDPAELLKAGLLSIGLLSTGGDLAAAEPPPASDDEPSLELLEFLADYGSDSGELELPAELNAVDVAAISAPTREQTAAPVTPPSPTGSGDPKP